jgi:hypothetical protein
MFLRKKKPCVSGAGFEENENTISGHRKAVLSLKVTTVVKPVWRQPACERRAVASCPAEKVWESLRHLNTLAGKDTRRRLAKNVQDRTGRWLGLSREK